MEPVCRVHERGSGYQCAKSIGYPTVRRGCRRAAASPPASRARDPAAVAVVGKDLVIYVNPELQRLRALVDAARARLAELEAGFTIEKAKSRR